MKRKIALLLAAAMTITMLPMTVFGMTNNTLTKSPTVVPGSAVFFEPGAIPAGYTGKTVAVNGSGGIDADYIVDGSYLRLALRAGDTVNAGDEFKVTLENAKWYFMGNTKFVESATGATQSNVYTYVNGTAATATTVPTTTTIATIAPFTTSIPTTTATAVAIPTQTDFSTTLPTTTAISTDVPPSTTATSYATTYPIPTSYLVPYTTATSYATTYPTATTVAVPTTTTTTLPAVPAKGQLYDNAGRVMDVTSPNFILNANNGVYVRSAATDAKEVPYTLRISELSDKTAIITIDRTLTAANNDDYYILIPLATKVTDDGDLYVNVANTSNMTAIQEGRYRFGVAGGTATKTYVDDPQTARTVFPINILAIKELRVGTMKSAFASDKYTQISLPSGFYFTDNGNNSPKYDSVGVEAGITKKGTGNNWYSLEYKVLSNNEIDYSTLIFKYDINPSMSGAGAVFIKGLEVYADDNARLGDFNMSIRAYGSIGVENESFKAGTRAEFATPLTTDGTIPTLITGRLEDVAAENSNDDVHKTAKVIFEEAVAESWWSGRTTYFMMPEGAAFRKVDITDVDNLNITGNLKGQYYNTGKKNGYVTLDGNTMRWDNITVTANKKAKIKFDVWASLAVNYKGDLTLGVSTNYNNTSDVQPTVIAHTVQPITIATKVTDVKIGYQLFPVAAIEITENGAGYLEKGKTVEVTVDDNISMDMYFAKDYTHTLTKGDLKTKNWDATGGTITFDIDGASSTASTIKLDNLYLKIDRSVPESQVPYKLIVGGNAVAANWDGLYKDTTISKADLGNYFAGKDLFKVKGLEANYANVVSSSPDKVSILTAEVSVTADERYYTQGGKTFEMDAAAYIDAQKGTMMVPLRFIGYAFGLSESQVMFDDATRTVTLLSPTNKVVQVKIGDAYMIINGAQVPMRNAAGVPVAAVINPADNRTYVPFRAIGDAFGVPVSFDDATKTAYYNKGANAQTAVTTDSTTDTTTDTVSK